jgi:hypothetical protein
MSGGPVEFLLVLAILAAVVLFVSVPLRTDRHRAQPVGLGSASELPELEAARDAKYREIRDAELDYRTGKLSEADFRQVDGSLRAEAVEIMRAIDQAQEHSAPGGAGEQLPSPQS